jgi:hypothetical protein
MSRSRSRSIVGSWYDPAPVKKAAPKLKQKTTTEEVSHVDPTIQAYMGLRAIFSGVTFAGALWLATTIFQFPLFYGACVFHVIVVFALIKQDALRLGNRHTVTRYEGISLDTPTRYVDNDGNALLIRDVLKKDFVL